MKDSWRKDTTQELCEKLWIGLVTTMTKNYVEKGVPLIRNSDIKENRFKENLIHLEKDFAYSHIQRAFKENDVATVHTGDVGTSAVIPKRLIGAHGFATINSRLKTEVVFPKYYSYYLNSSFFKKQVYSVITGDGRNNLNLYDFINLYVQFPPLPQQRKIAQILSTVDAVLEKTEAAIAKYQQLKQGLMQDVFTRGIDVHTGQLRPKQTEAPELYKQSALGWIPKEWEVSGILKYCEEIFLGLTTKVDYVKEGGVPLIRAKDINSGYLKFDDVLQISIKQHKELTKNRKAKKGDVLITKSGTLGITALVDSDKEFSIYESILVLQSKQGELFSKFLLWLLREPTTLNRLLGQTVGSTIGHLNLLNFRKLLVVFPLYEEQKLISLKMDGLESKIQTEQQALAKYQQLKAGLLQDLLTGRVEVQVD